MENLLKGAIDSFLYSAVCFPVIYAFWPIAKGN